MVGESAHVAFGWGIRGGGEVGRLGSEAKFTQVEIVCGDAGNDLVWEFKSSEAVCAGTETDGVETILAVAGIV